MTRVSIIVPVHNTAKYLPTCINSILNQTEQNIEIICINDHSTDNSLDILRYYEKISSKIKVIDMLDKFGVSSARNEGLKIANGEYIGFVDSDDVVSLTMFRDFYCLAKEYLVPIVIGHNKRISEQEFLNLETYYVHERKKNTIIDTTKDEEIFFICSCWDKLFNHDFILNEKFIENCIYEDVGFTFPLLFKAKKVLNVSEKDYLYRKNLSGISDSSQKVNSQIFDILTVTLDAMERAKRYKLSKTQMYYLENLLKKAILSRLQYISKWNIEEHYKKFILEKILSICNFYFPHIKQFISHDTDPANNALVHLANYSYREISSKKIATEELKRVKRMTRSLQK